MKLRYPLALLLAGLATPAGAQSATPPATQADEDPAMAPRLEDRPASLPPIGGDALVDSPIVDELNRNDRLLIEHKGTAVPAWVIGDGKALNGFDPAVLRAAIARARATHG